MKKENFRLASLMLALLLMVSMFAPSAFAANYTTNYQQYSAPSSSDFAYWNGSRVVRASGTTTSEVKWMQATLNYCIEYEGLNATKLDVDGSFGPASKKAALAFQKATGLEQDGSFGPDTIQKMKTVLSDGKATFATNTTSGTWLWPCKTRSLSCQFGDTYYHTSWTHRGVDIRAYYEDVYASKSGVVYQMGYNSSRGYWAVIDHQDGTYSAYQHLNRYYVSSGTYVKQGQVIAQSGASGQGTGPHLHFEVMNLGKSGLAKSYNSYFNQFSKYVNTNPTQKMTAGFRLNNGTYVSTFSDSKGINYKFK